MSTVKPCKINKWFCMVTLNCCQWRVVHFLFPSETISHLFQFGNMVMDFWYQGRPDSISPSLLLNGDMRNEQTIAYIQCCTLGPSYISTMLIHLRFTVYQQMFQARRQIISFISPSSTLLNRIKNLCNRSCELSFWWQKKFSLIKKPWLRGFLKNIVLLQKQWLLVVSTRSR